MTLSALLIAGTISPFMGPLDEPDCTPIRFDVYADSVFPISDAPEMYELYKILHVDRCGETNWAQVNISRMRPKARGDVIPKGPTYEQKTTEGLFAGIDRSALPYSLDDSLGSTVVQTGSVWNFPEVVSNTSSGSNAGNVSGGVFGNSGQPLTSNPVHTPTENPLRETYRPPTYNPVKDTYRKTPQPAPVPLPASFWMLLASVVGLWRKSND